MLTGLWVVDERVSLRAMDELEVLCARLAKNGLGFWRHDVGVVE